MYSFLEVLNPFVKILNDDDYVKEDELYLFVRVSNFAMGFPRRLFKFRKDTFFLSSNNDDYAKENEWIYFLYAFRIHFSIEFPNRLSKFRKDPPFYNNNDLEE